jgi:hypothetical protein
MVPLWRKSLAIIIPSFDPDIANDWQRCRNLCQETPSSPMAFTVGSCAGPHGYQGFRSEIRRQSCAGDETLQEHLCLLIQPEIPGRPRGVQNVINHLMARASFGLLD